MIAYVVQRLIGIVGVLLAVSVITFFMMHAVPGGPFDAAQKQEIPVPESVRQEFLRKYQLDRPLPVQYVSFLASALRGDFGRSFRVDEPVTEFIGRTWPVTLRLGLITMAIAFPLGLIAGMLAALRPNSWLDYLLSVAVVTNIVTPTFVVAILLIVVFSVRLQWLPTGGIGTWKHWVMPILAYSLAPTAVIARYTRVAMLEVTNTDFIRTARAKGLHERTVIGRHAFKNALIPLLTIMGPLAATMVTGSFFIETIFRIPGMGNQLTLAIYNRDYPVIMTLSLLWSTVIALTYLATDLLYAWIDPRVRLTGR
ncbi:MAG: ABC transporter permease [Anaerolineae bacterium]|nr:ABC transporter permease [Anaerolineae bacterium]